MKWNEKNTRKTCDTRRTEKFWNSTIIMLDETIVTNAAKRRLGQFAHNVIAVKVES